MIELIGKRVDNYLLKEHLGRGAFGEVFLAEYGKQAKQVALKILKFHLGADDAENIRAFLEEARSIRLEHSNIIRVRDFGITSDLGVESGRPYIVMDYIPSGNLRQRHPRKTKLSWEIIIPYIKQVASALQYIHDEGLVHRDIKPENMLIGANGEILLSDFGIATTSATWRSTIVQKAQGTPLYAAPEQIGGRAVRASDQYALGAVMYEWLSGERLFTGTAQQVIAKHLTVLPTPLSQKVPTISPLIEAIVMKMLAKDPDDRFASIREFIDAVDDANASFVTPVKLVLEDFIFTAHTEDVHAVSWSPDGTSIASAGRDQSVFVWQPASGDIVCTYREHSGLTYALSWSPDSKYLASAGSDKAVHVWAATTGYSINRYGGHTEPVRTVAWSPDGKALASASEDRTVQVWEPGTGKRLCQPLKHTTRVYACTWSPESSYIASGTTDGSVSIWEVATATCFQVYSEHRDKITSLAWSPDGLYIASASYDDTVRIWDLERGHCVCVYTGHTNTISSVAWSPNGQYIASASWDGTIHVWQPMDGKRLFLYQKHRSWVTALSWSCDSRYLISGSWDKTVHLFALPDLSSV